MAPVITPSPNSRSVLLPQAKPRSSWLMRFTGFSKTSSFVLFALTAGLFSLFSAAHLQFLDRDGIWYAPLTMGERYWALDGARYYLTQIHLWSVIPAGVLLPLQFLPVVRRRYAYLHRNAGRFLFILLGFGSITGASMAKTSFGGTVTTIAFAYILFALCTFGTYKSWSSIRRSEMGQHRVWALRTWASACSILSLRVFLVVFTILCGVLQPEYRQVFNCALIEYLQRGQYDGARLDHALVSYHERYPSCANPPTLLNETYVIVRARVAGEHTLPEEEAALFNILFGVSGFVGLLINLVAVEFYLDYTSDENTRLRKISIAKIKPAGLNKLVVTKSLPSI